MDIPEFNGEFGSEIDRAIPHAYKLYKDGKLNSIKYMKGVRVFYESIFPKSILIMVENYKRYDGNGTGGWDKYIGKDNHMSIDKFGWKAPNWKGKFINIPLNFINNKPLFIIHNKYTQEWGMNPINFIPLKTMKKLYKYLSKHFNVIIIHPRGNTKGYIEDLQQIKSFNYNGMQTIYDIMKNHPNLDYNTTQVALQDRCKHFISVQGGSSRLASMFGGINIVLHIKGSEMKHDEYNKVLSRLSNVDIHVVHSPHDLLKKVYTIFGKKINTINYFVIIIIIIIIIIFFLIF